MKKKIMKIGSSKGIIFSKKECELYQIEIGDIVDLDDAIFEKSKGGKKK